jgi:hypothetical protein
MPKLADQRWSTEKRHDVHSREKFVEGASRFRKIFWEEAMGRFDEPLLPPASPPCSRSACSLPA